MQDSDSKRRVEHPAGDSAANTEAEQGHQGSTSVVATGAETPVTSWSTAAMQATRTTLLHESGSSESKLQAPCHEAPARGRPVR